MSAYADEIINIETEMKRVRKHLKQLRELKKKPTQALHRYMVGNNLKIYKSIKIEKITPPLPKIPKKTPTQKKTPMIFTIFGRFQQKKNPMTATKF